VYCYRLKKYIGSYVATLGGVDAIVFTAGVGENSAPVRSLTCSGMEFFGIRIDEEKSKSRREQGNGYFGRWSQSPDPVVPPTRSW